MGIFRVLCRVRQLCMNNNNNPEARARLPDTFHTHTYTRRRRRHARPAPQCPQIFDIKPQHSSSVPRITGKRTHVTRVHLTGSNYGALCTGTAEPFAG